MQNVSDCSRMFQIVPEFFISLHAVTSACMQLHKLTCSYISLHAVPWACMQLPELPGRRSDPSSACSSLNCHEVQWAYMKFHELACSFMSLHSVPFFVWAAHKNLELLVHFKILIFQENSPHPLMEFTWYHLVIWQEMTMQRCPKFIFTKMVAESTRPTMVHGTMVAGDAWAPPVSGLCTWDLTGTNKCTCRLPERVLKWLTSSHVFNTSMSNKW